MTQALIAAENLGITFGSRQVLSDVCLALLPGEITTIIGPNGAGKSTLARTLLGLQKPHRGSVRRMAGLRIGYMPQQLHLDPSLPLSVERFVGLGGARPKHSLAALEQVGVPHLLHEQMHTLSGGERQRVLLARALVRKPQLLVLDEPEQAMDVTGQSALYQLIGQLRDELHCGVLLISHELHLVMASTDTVVCLNQHVCCHGHPDQVRNNPAYLELFGHQADSGLAPYTHHHDHTHESTCTHRDRHDPDHHH